MAKRGTVTAAAQRLTDGKINRRRFIMSAVASGVTLPTATALATKAEARVAKAGGTLRIATATAPGVRNGAFDALLAFAVGNGLTRLDSAGKPMGELAERVEVSSDHRRWRFTLRKGVQFHDGQPLTAATVVASLRALGFAEGVAVAEGEGTVAISLHTPTPDLAHRLARQDAIIRSQSGSTTGGYRIEQRGDMLVRLTRAGPYWKPNAAHFDAVKIRAIPDAALRHRAVMNGEVDYADEISPQTVGTLKGLPTLDVLETPNTHHLALAMHDDVPPFDDPSVRTALALSLDSDALLQDAAFGHGEAVALFPPTPYSLPPQSVPSPLTIHVSEAALPGSLAFAKLVAKQAMDGGIEANIRDHRAEAWPKAASRAGWHVTKGNGAPHPDALPALRLNALAAHSTALAHPDAVSSVIENDGHRLAERWWFA